MQHSQVLQSISAGCRRILMLLTEILNRLIHANSRKLRGRSNMLGQIFNYYLIFRNSFEYYAMVRGNK